MTEGTANPAETASLAAGAGFGLITPLIAVLLQKLHPLTQPSMLVNGVTQHGVWSWAGLLFLIAVPLLLTLTVPLALVEQRRSEDGSASVALLTAGYWLKAVFAYFVAALTALTVSYLLGFTPLQSSS